MDDLCDTSNRDYYNVAKQKPRARWPVLQAASFRFLQAKKISYSCKVS